MRNSVMSERKISPLLVFSLLIFSVLAKAGADELKPTEIGNNVYDPQAMKAASAALIKEAVKFESLFSEKQAELKRYCDDGVFTPAQCAHSEALLNEKGTVIVQGISKLKALADVYELFVVIGESPKSAVEKLAVYGIVQKLLNEIIAGTVTAEEHRYKVLFAEVSDYYRKDIIAPKLKVLFQSISGILSEDQAKRVLDDLSAKAKPEQTKKPKTQKENSASFMRARKLQTKEERRLQQDKENGCYYQNGRKSCMR